MKNDEIINQIKLRFGAPQITVELSEEQFNEAFVIAEEEFNLITSILSRRQYKKKLKIKEIWIKRYASAVCKEILGRLRGKFSHVNLPGGDFKLDSETLIRESENEKRFLFEIGIQKTIWL